MAVAEVAEAVRAAVTGPPKNSGRFALLDPRLHLVGLGLVIRPALRSALTWSIAAAFVASSSFCVEIPRWPATLARNPSPRVGELLEAAIAPPAPTTSERADAATSARLE